ncbi:MAG: DNA double-strand break repair nuclease NurA [Synechococcales bacterium]|nr:DNA double-strand break repair nuclease NurA [Synechococcales bacterium]
MPLKPTQILAQLNNRREDFTRFDEQTTRDLEKYRTALKQAMAEPTATIQQQLAKIADCGARPLEPWDNFKDWIIPFGISWTTREESLAWVRDRLTGISTFAVDGSQIYPGKDLSIPVALVQIGWFENRHANPSDYVKDIDCCVMTPEDLRVERLGGDLADRKVNLRRFQMETERLMDYLEEHEACQDALAFFDGSFVVTFAEAMDDETRARYVQYARNILDTSDNFQVPVVAYIDTSTARDMASMLQKLYHLPNNPAIHDALLFNRIEHHKMEWGDRTPLFLCQRSGVLSQYKEQTDQVIFCYLKTNRDRYPVRLEFPLWVYQSGRMEQILDWVRGEIAIGSGYPYVIETADQVAVVKGEDRQAFYRIFQEWSEQEDLNLRLSRKMVSKLRRR